MLLLTHFGITNPLFIYLFILLSAENLCHVNRPRGPVVKHSEEKNVAPVSWIHYHVSETTADKSDCLSLLLFSFIFVLKVVCLQRSEHLFLRHNRSNSRLPLQRHHRRSSLNQAFNKKLDLTWNYR